MSVNEADKLLFTWVKYLNGFIHEFINGTQYKEVEFIFLKWLDQGKNLKRKSSQQITTKINKLHKVYSFHNRKTKGVECEIQWCKIKWHSRNFN